MVRLCNPICYVQRQAALALTVGSTVLLEKFVRLGVHLSALLDQDLMTK